MTTFESVLPNVATTSTVFGELSPDQQAEIWSLARVRQLLSGETLVLQNTATDAIFVVVSGRFEVRVERQTVPLAEIGAGQPIGEVAFFAGGLRTATVVAVRDLVVLELDRASFEKVARRVPAVYDQLLASLARRIADTTARVACSTRVAAARTVPPSSQLEMAAFRPEFFHRLRAALAGLGKCLFLRHADLKERFPNLGLDDATIVNWLNAIESEYDLILYLADAKPTDWTRKAIRQADELILLAYGAAAAGLNAVEEIGLAIHPASRRRLVRITIIGCRSPPVRPTGCVSETLRCTIMSHSKMIRISKVSIASSRVERWASWPVAAADLVRPMSASLKPFRSGAQNSTYWVVRALGRRCWLASRCFSRPRSLISHSRIFSFPTVGSSVGRFPDIRCSIMSNLTKRYSVNAAVPKSRTYGDLISPSRQTSIVPVTVSISYAADRSGRRFAPPAPSRRFCRPC